MDAWVHNKPLNVIISETIVQIWCVLCWNIHFLLIMLLHYTKKGKNEMWNISLYYYEYIVQNELFIVYKEDVIFIVTVNVLVDIPGIPWGRTLHDTIDSFSMTKLMTSQYRCTALHRYSEIVCWTDSSSSAMQNVLPSTHMTLAPAWNYTFYFKTYNERANNTKHGTDCFPVGLVY